MSVKRNHIPSLSLRGRRGKSGLKEGKDGSGSACRFSSSGIEEQPSCRRTPKES